MITRHTRSLSVGFAALGMLSLAGCAIQTAAAIPGTGSGPGSTATGRNYADGTYTVDAGYQAPSGTESITVELALSDGVVS
jgi:hypothetical protein